MEKNRREQRPMMRGGLGDSGEGLPGDVDAFAYPLRVVDLLHHEVGYVCSGDAVAVARKGVAVDAVGAAGGRVAEHGWHDHGPVEVASGEGGVLGDLRGNR